jgi:hypothetical protein
MTTPSKLAYAAPSESDRPGPGDSDFDQPSSDPGSVVGVTRASHNQRHNGRTRHVEPTISEWEGSTAEVEFMEAMREYKQRSGRLFPTWCEVLEVLCGLGYKKVAADGSDRKIVSHVPAHRASPEIKPKTHG